MDSRNFVSFFWLIVPPSVTTLILSHYLSCGCRDEKEDAIEKTLTGDFYSERISSSALSTVGRLMSVQREMHNGCEVILNS